MNDKLPASTQILIEGIRRLNNAYQVWKTTQNEDQLRLVNAHMKMLADMAQFEEDYAEEE